MALRWEKCKITFDHSRKDLSSCTIIEFTLQCNLSSFVKGVKKTNREASQGQASTLILLYFPRRNSPCLSPRVAHFHHAGVHSTISVLDPKYRVRCFRDSKTPNIANYFWNHNLRTSFFEWITERDPTRIHYISFLQIFSPQILNFCFVVMHRPQIRLYGNISDPKYWHGAPVLIPNEYPLLPPPCGHFMGNGLARQIFQKASRWALAHATGYTNQFLNPKSLRRSFRFAHWCYGNLIEVFDR